MIETSDPVSTRKGNFLPRTVAATTIVEPEPAAAVLATRRFLDWQDEMMVQCSLVYGQATCTMVCNI